MTEKPDQMQAVDEFDRLASQDSSLHRHDPRAKLLVVLFAASVAASYSRYAVIEMLPLFLLPIAWLAQSGTPLRFVLSKLLLALPFVLFMAIFNPLFDRTPVLALGALNVSGGWLSFASILLRFLISMSLIVLLVATTGFNTLCAALLRLHVPKLLVVQLLLLYRYIFLLAEEAQRVRLAYALRAVEDQGIALPVAGSLLGQLLLRVMARGQRIHQAMLCRGFSGDLSVRRDFRWRHGDSGFVLAWVAWLLLARFIDIPAQVGQLVLRGLA